MLVLVYFALGITYFFVFALASVFPYRMKQHQHEKIHRFAVLIPAYKEDAIIADVCRESLKQDYPSDYYDVVVVADSFQDATIEKIKQMNIQVVEVSFERSTKSKALNAALDKLPENRYDLAVILDADNIKFPFKDKSGIYYECKSGSGPPYCKKYEHPFCHSGCYQRRDQQQYFPPGPP
jgi:cellulose synthase/poly-beta-1,6-N-acetylglucosamine synthase-like glycosyltransferase